MTPATIALAAIVAGALAALFTRLAFFGIDAGRAERACFAAAVFCLLSSAVIRVC